MTGVQTCALPICAHDATLNVADASISSFLTDKGYVVSEYQGMRWVKADFQVQTPEDSKNWADPELRLGNPRRPKTGNVACELDIQNKTLRDSCDW